MKKIKYEEFDSNQEVERFINSKPFHLSFLIAITQSHTRAGSIVDNKITVWYWTIDK